MVKVFVIDPGHGGKDPGAVSNGIKEKDLTLKIAKLIKQYLDTHYTGHRTILTRDKDVSMTLAQRTTKANNLKADYFLSVHINAGGGSGYEDFIYSGLNDTGKTAKLRNVVHSESSKAVKWRNRGKKKANFHVLRETRMPAMLSENGFIDHKEDAKKLKDNSVLIAIAKAHAVGLAKAFNLKKKAKSSTKPSDKPKLYKVQVGAYSKRTNAEKMASDLKKAGFPAYIYYE